MVSTAQRRAAGCRQHRRHRSWEFVEGERFAMQAGTLLVEEDG